MVHLVQSKEDLDQRVLEAGDKLIVIDFFANWCGPCKIISPKLEELAQQYADSAVVLKVNVDDNEDITIKYNVTSMPTFVFMKNGAVVDIFAGSNSDKLAKSMEKYVTNVCECQLECDQLTDEPGPSEGGSAQSISSIESGTAEAEDAAAADTTNDGAIEAIDQEGVLEN
ncbi:thioredoxin-2 [Drosophila guanche]|uniref:Blast:Thioredoxin-T n=1 Tax=Drosophila guanche TaxID=7266 RepID=A0A3B0K560_DROGU|nr:thioredoxin-2 [Drosophila guanche]XP_034139736.1 thioredoxin-2 [Drosophila guanche]SPP89275.1 blast:Thioredoxin-T [Drosophila guanche]